MIPDVHAGIQDDRSIGLMLECAEDFGVHRAVQLGDLWDCYAISRHDQAADRVRGRCYTLAEEAEEVRYILDWMGRTKKRSMILVGNHEDRLAALVDQNPGLFDSLSIRAVFGVPKRVVVLEQYGQLVAGSLVLEHGHKLPRSLSRYGVASVLEHHPDQTTVYGHTHRIAEWRRTTYDREGRPRTRMALSLGHLSIPGRHVHYSAAPNWQQGFGLVEFWRDRGALRYTIYPVEIHDHAFRFMGRTYR